MSNLDDYPHDWKEVATAVKDEAGWRCVRCKHPHESPNKRIFCDEKCDFLRHPEISSMEYDFEYYSDLDQRRITFTETQKQRVLTVHHLDGKKDNLRWWNLAALCQVCHLIIQAKVKMERPWIMFEHSEWFKPYAAGYYAFKYLDKEVTREEAMLRLDDLLMLESPRCPLKPTTNWFKYLGEQ
jgi:hypothetical protein